MEVKDIKTHGLGSLSNVLIANTASKAPAVGDGATEVLWTDRYPYFVIEVRTPRKVVLQAADVKWKPFPSGYAESVTPDPDGRTVTVRLHKDGRWRSTGGTIYRIGGEPGAYRDPSF